MMLRVSGLEAGYHQRKVLFGVSLEVRKGELVALIGPNGAGKSTVLKVIHGLASTWSGEMWLDSNSLSGLATCQRVSLGLALVPQGRRVFDELSVMENLELAGYFLDRSTLLERIDKALTLATFLKSRLSQRAGSLSGGEQQLLAVARSIVPNARLLMLDEPSLGLAPGPAALLFEQLAEMSAKANVAMLVVEHKVHEVLTLCQRVYSMKLGAVAFEGKAYDLLQNEQLLKELLIL